MFLKNSNNYVLFADDINILFSCETFNIVETMVNIELNLLFTNKLSINLSKTNFIVFNNRKCSFIPKVDIDNHQVELTY